ncbi:levansucrase [Streptomyces sp. NPDC093085]|uniref:levansucrase n=1 Tax=Streptomyces sp. NPDC093085 TaxID=3155068 RepID=UPI0034350814
MTTEQASAYLNGLAERLAADGCTTYQDNWSGAPVLVGRRADFRLRWMATKLHLFTIATAVPVVGISTIAGFTTQSLRYAREKKGGLPVGLQNGVGVFPVLVAEQVDPAALAWAEEKQRNDFACMARPVVVDLSTGRTATFRRRNFIGGGYAGHFIRKGSAYFPELGG